MRRPRRTARRPTTRRRGRDLADAPVAARPRCSPPDELPRHVAIIMDGNRRWARLRDLPELDGHAAGVEAIRALAPPRGPARRPGPDAVRVQPRELGPLRRRGRPACSACSRRPSGARPTSSRRRASGSGCSAGSTSCPTPTRASIGEALDATAGGERLLLNVAFNYAGRTEIVDAVRQLAASGIPADEIDEAAISGALYTAGLPDPDLVIRTGGEQRLSNFLIWQSAYAEFYSCEALWPDFGPDAFDAALLEFARRHRRFGR